MRNSIELFAHEAELHTGQHGCAVSCAGTAATVGTLVKHASSVTGESAASPAMPDSDVSRSCSGIPRRVKTIPEDAE